MWSAKATVVKNANSRNVWEQGELRGIHAECSPNQIEQCPCKNGRVIPKMPRLCAECGVKKDALESEDADDAKRAKRRRECKHRIAVAFARQ